MAGRAVDDNLMAGNYASFSPETFTHAPFPREFLSLAHTVLSQCQRKKMKLATAESCTGGLISGLLTEISGASAVFTHGFITYSNTAKTEVLGVSPVILDHCGAVSEDCALAMAEGALSAAQAHGALSVTGIAGPDGGTPQKPVGLVHMAVARRDLPTVHQRHYFSGTRSSIRLLTVWHGLLLLAQHTE